ncbi:MAG: DNA repair protein RecO [Chloroflexota bacterium]|nr:DNA repair protein RecO [Chloroflexota bacterium]MDE3194507.1 DNA repair protein RecO [Chloroflexota bacterium]
MASRTYRAEAIVLKTLDLGEADRILTLLTRHFGKVKAIAKGIRRPTSRLAGYAEPLSHATFQLARGRELDVLTGAESRSTYRLLREDLDRIAAAWYIAEIADRTTAEHAPAAPVFDLVETALRHLEVGHVPSLICRWSDLHLLDRTGFRPELLVCARCSGALRETTNGWSPLDGGAVCVDCIDRSMAGLPALSVRALKSLRYLLTSDFAAAARLRIDAALEQELERHLRAFLHHVLDREIASARLIDELARLPRRTSPSLS